ncbi:executer 1, chloroplastic-like protein [Tanacetum coccineum]
MLSLMSRKDGLVKQMVESALQNEVWRKAMCDEISAIERNGTWELVDLPAVRMILALAAQPQWTIYQFDVKSAFLNGELNEESQLNRVVVKEDYEDVARIKVAIAAAATNDTVGRVMAQLNKAIKEERYKDASFIRDYASAGESDASDPIAPLELPHSLHPVRFVSQPDALKEVSFQAYHNGSDYHLSEQRLMIGNEEMCRIFGGFGKMVSWPQERYRGSLQKTRLGLQVLEDVIYGPHPVGLPMNLDGMKLIMGISQSEAQSVSTFVQFLQNQINNRIMSSLVDMSQKDQCHPVWGLVESYAAGRDKKLIGSKFGRNMLTPNGTISKARTALEKIQLSMQELHAFDVESSDCFLVRHLGDL